MFKSSETFIIPDKKGPLIIGSKGANVKRIKSESGAEIIVDMKRQPHTAKIIGTSSQCARAKELIKALLNKGRTIPLIGFTFLGSDDAFDLKGAKFRFVKFTGNDSNAHSQKMAKYHVEKVDDEPDDKHDDDGMDDLANQLRHGLTLPSPKGGFVTWDKFGECLEVICEQLSKADPTSSVRKEIRLNIFFGRQLFTKVEDRIVNKNFDAHDWCSFKRDPGIGSSFQHNSPQIVDNMTLIQEKFGLKLRKETLDGDKGSISIYGNLKDNRRKWKFHWFEEEGLWKITRAAKNIQREGIVDLVSGTSMPDMRFLLKSQYDLSVDVKDEKILAELQSKPLVKKEGLWFRLSDFEGKCDFNRIRQTTRKSVYSNDKFQVTLQSILNELQDDNSKETQIATEETISVKHLSWRAVEKIDKTPSLHFDEEELSATIRDTIEFAREIAKAVR